MKKLIIFSLITLLNSHLFSAVSQIETPPASSNQMQSTDSSGSTQFENPPQSDAEKRAEQQLSAWLIEASKAAEDYVRLLDNGKYAESWTQSAKLFQQTISQNEWKTALELARKRLGGVKSRSLKDIRTAFDPKGLPAGAYMVVIYTTNFDRAPNTEELLTLMRESNGQWKVLTYQVTPGQG